MPTADERLANVRLKIERAKQHIRDFESELIAIRDDNPYELVREENPKLELFVRKIKLRHQLPLSNLSLIVGESIHQLRSSLDHLAWQLVEANGQIPGRHTYFPIYETAAEYKAKSSRSVQGIGLGAIDIIEAVQPYQTGYEDLWRIHELNNFEKHRLLPVIAIQASSIVHTFTKDGQWFMFKPSVEAVNAEIKELKDGAVIVHISGIVNPDVQENCQISFDIAFDKPEIVHGQSVMVFLTQSASLVDRVVGLFSSLL